MARNGIVTTSQPLAAQAGLRIMMHGGNAIDAAVATAAVLNLVEPMNVGLAGDLFAVIYIAKERKTYVLNASGMAPTGQTIAFMKSMGYQADPANFGPGSGMPRGGILPVTVPGAAWGWDEVVKRFGKLKLKEDLGPAIDYAENGFPISERIAHDWVLPPALPTTGCCKDLDPDSVATWYANGKPPLAGQIFRNPDLAKTLRMLGNQGRDAFYKGPIARAIVAKSHALGGTMTLADLANYRGEWVQPVSTNYHGFDVLTLPPPSQNWATNEALNILEACVPQLTGSSLAKLGPVNPIYWHMLIEAKKLAYADLFTYNGDPNFVSVPLDRLLSKSYAATLCSKIDPNRASKTGPGGSTTASGDTIVLATADRWGNMVSWVNSNFAGFGSGLTVPGYGFILHNRGSLFTLDPASPNAIAPHKRPFNTLAAAFMMQHSEPLMAFELMGGDMQAQGHEQIMVDVIDLGANVQQAGDMARFHHSQVPNDLTMESDLFGAVGQQLQAMGHQVTTSDRGPMGGYQGIAFMVDHSRAAVDQGDTKAPVNGYYRAGSDFGKDGEAVGW
jgi:gamma-glutamyltranspeptidase / glutathione hydrolase